MTWRRQRLESAVRTRPYHDGATAAIAAASTRYRPARRVRIKKRDPDQLKEARYERRRPAGLVA